MSSILLRDILINARQEAVQMGHYYLGVEHLFIALLQIQGGLATSVLEQYGLPGDYLIDTLRRKTDRGATQVLWVGIPYTPRTEIILNIANDLALENSAPEASERDLLCAILHEGESLPARILQNLKVDLGKLAEVARTHTLTKEPQPPDIEVMFGDGFDHADDVSREQLFILRRMFTSHRRIRIERRLTGFRGALILVVTPIRADNREDASVVVKIDQTDNILDEVQRYEAHVKHALPLQTARLEDIPTAPDSSQLAGVKYTLVTSDDTTPKDLRNVVQEQGTNGIGRLIQQGLYAHFSKTWWKQRRPFRFQVWKEYDWLLPPILTLEMLPEKELQTDAHLLRIPFNRAKLKTKLHEIQFGDVMVLENFTVQRVDRVNNVLKLAVGYGSEADKRAYKVDIKGVTFSKNTFYRGQIIEHIVGKVWKTRHDVLLDAARALEPDFDLRGQTIPLGEQQIPNPILYYEDLLDRHVNGSLSKVHGDLHLGNILLGPNNSTWLIDFAHTRDGHTLFDWATLEISILGDGVMLVADDEWETARTIVQYLAALDARTVAPTVSSEVFAGMASVAAIREIARDCLTSKDNWQEYFIALALCALRAITWTTLSLGGKRVMFLVAGLSMMELTRKSINVGIMETPSPDEADRTDQLQNAISTQNVDSANPPSDTNAKLSSVPQNPLLQHIAQTMQFDEPPSEFIAHDDEVQSDDTSAIPSDAKDIDSDSS